MTRPQPRKLALLLGGVFGLSAFSGLAMAADTDNRTNSPAYPQNDRGQSYGKLPIDGSQLSLAEIPDLVFVVGGEAVEGYIPAELLFGDSPASLVDTPAGQAPVDQLPVLAEDGITILGTFQLSALPEREG